MPKAEVIDISSRRPKRPVALQLHQGPARRELVAELLAQLIRDCQTHARSQQVLLSVLLDRLTNGGDAS